MWFNRDANLYSLSPVDIAIMGEAGIDINEMMRLRLKFPGLPPVWSKIPYLMLLNPVQTDTRLFWKAYREFECLLQDADHHYTHAYIPKNNGKTRALMIPDEILHPHQRFIFYHILRHIPVSEYAFAYREGRGLTDLAQPHIGHDTLIHLDIQDFFSSITQQMVFEALCRQTGYPKTVAGFISRLCCYRKHLPQGACTSPALSNICFKDCDEKVAQLAQQYDLTYTRYSDDLYLSGNNVNAGPVIEAIGTILAQHGFRINRKKTRILGKHQAQRVTAIIVNEKMQVSREYRRSLRQELYYLKKFGADAEGVRRAQSHQSYLYHLLGKVTFVLYIDPGKQEFLEAKRYLLNQLNQQVFPHF